MPDPKTIRDLKFTVLRNAIYHSSRRGFFDTINRLLSFAVVAGGTAAVANMGISLGAPLWIFPTIAAVSGLAQLVFDFGGKTRTHEFLQRRFYELNADIAETPPTDKALAQWESTLSRLYAEEPPPMRALDAISYNAAASSMGFKQRLVINRRQSFFKHLLPYNKAEFPYDENANTEPFAPSI